MKTIAILAQKGGVGKTTLCINLAVAAEQKKKSAGIVDLDTQGSSYLWGETRESDTPEVVTAFPVSLPKIIDAAKAAKTQRLFIDTPGVGDIASKAASFADVILIPVKASGIDLRAVQHTIDIVAPTGKPYFILVNMAPTSGTLTDEVLAALEDTKTPFCPVVVKQRIAFIRSFFEGQGVLEYGGIKDRAAQEIKSLYTWLERQLKK